ncbi:MAG: alpha/beta hydrolase [Chloroflexi bacterium]|nr:MAG: alpha/beta hydrolase [Chloroflexota bacterium]
MSGTVYPPLPRRFVSALGIRTAYYVAGRPNGRPVLLLHGMSTSADSFRETMHALADSHWLIAPDIPGFGFSEHTTPYTLPHLVEWLAAFWQTLDLPPVALVGHSFGGILAASFAVAYPEDVTHLLLVAPAILSQAAFPDVVKKMGISLGLVDLGSAVSQSKVWLNRQIRAPFFAPDKQDESVWERRLADYEHARASADVLKALAFHDVRPQLARLTQPVCLVWGENDPVVPVTDADKLVTLLPNAPVSQYVLSECGHVPMLEQQAVFQGIVRDFLAGKTAVSDE